MTDDCGGDCSKKKNTNYVARTKGQDGLLAVSAAGSWIKRRGCLLFCGQGNCTVCYDTDMLIRPQCIQSIVRSTVALQSSICYVRCYAMRHICVLKIMCLCLCDDQTC